MDKDIKSALELEGGTGGGLKKLVAAAIIIALSLGAVYFYFAGDKAVGTRYITQKAERGSLSVTVVATGTLRPVNQVDVGSEISGTIKTVEADYNDRVRKGQVLARLDTERLSAQLKQSEASQMSAEADLLEAQATLLEARRSYERMKRLWDESGGTTPSLSGLEESEATFKRAEAREAGAQARVFESHAVHDANRTSLEKAVIRSPIDGVVLVRNVEPGQTVSASLQAPVLFTLAEDLRHMELHVDVDEAEVGQVREGQSAIFTVDAYPGLNFDADIAQIRLGAKTLEGVVTYETVLSVDNSDVSLRPGMTATAVISVRRVDDAILVPNAALRFTPPATDNNGNKGSTSFISKMFPRSRRSSQKNQNRNSEGEKHQTVWLLVDGRPEPVKITAGATDGTRTEVVEGKVEPGMELVVDMEQVK